MNLRFTIYHYNIRRRRRPRRRRRRARTRNMAPIETYLSRRGYAVLKTGTAENQALIEELKASLTVSPKVHPDMAALAPGDAEPVSFPVFRESSKKLYLPKYYGLQRFGPPRHDALSAGNDTTLVFRGTLRPEQVIASQNYIQAVQDPTKMGGILSLFCGGGKTVLALYLTAYFKKKTLILVHKEFLMNQWKEEIQAFLPDARVGLIKQSKVQVADKDIVIASVQSVAMRDYPAEVFESFGMIIIDECHHMGAEVFSRALPKITSRIMLGLSATLERNDGMTKVFCWYLGVPVYSQKKRADTGTEVRMVSYYNPHPDYGRELSFHRAGRKILRTPNMISNIAMFEPRNLKIIELVRDLMEREPRRQFIILSERIAQLRHLETLFRPHYTTGFYIGGMPQSELDKSATRQVILASYQMSSEGMNIPTLNTLILATPICSVEQSIGRIQRQKPEEREYIPLVIDIWDRFSRFQSQGKTRIKHYTAQGYTITYEGIGACEESDSNSNSKSKTYMYRDDEEESDTTIRNGLHTAAPPVPAPAPSSKHG
jgi:superfamily II DNA or RNA helicase